MSSDQHLPFAITIKVRDACLCLHLQRAARAVARRFDTALRPLGLTSGQFSLLMSLNRPEPPTIGSVSALLAMDRTTLTANLKPLQRRRLVQVTVDDADKRTRRLALTPAGAGAAGSGRSGMAANSCSDRRSSPRSDPDELRADLRALSSADL